MLRNGIFWLKPVINHAPTKPMSNHYSVIRVYSYYAPKICLNKDEHSIRDKKKKEKKSLMFMFIYPKESLPVPSLQVACRVFFTQQVDINNKNCSLRFICLHWYFMSTMYSHRVKSSKTKAKQHYSSR